MTLAELKYLIDTNLPDNTTGLITPAKERQVMKAISDFVVSSQGEADSGSFIFDAGITYDLGDPVIYANAWYLSLAGSNINNIPSSSPASWEAINAFNTVLSIWETDAVYLGDLTIVLKDNALYLLDRAVVGADPFLSTDFAAELAAGKWANLLADIPPLANTYADDAAMIADQTSQVSGYFYFGGATLYIYLGTTGGNIGDYFALGGGGGGGIASVGAGTGIAVDVTSPSNPIVKLSTGALADIGKGVTAESWGNHALAGYVQGVTGYGVNNADPDNPLLEFVASTESLGALMKFDKHYVHGNAAAITGNITFDFTGEKIGSTVFMTHNQGTVPTLPAEARLIGGTYTISVNNYIAATLIKAGSPRIVWVTIGKV